MNPNELRKFNTRQKARGLEEYDPEQANKEITDWTGKKIPKHRGKKK